MIGGVPVAVRGDAVASHGLPPHSAAVMVGASFRVFAGGIPVCRAGDIVDSPQEREDFLHRHRVVPALAFGEEEFPRISETVLREIRQTRSSTPTYSHPLPTYLECYHGESEERGCKHQIDAIPPISTKDLPQQSPP